VRVSALALLAVACTRAPSPSTAAAIEQSPAPAKPRTDAPAKPGIHGTVTVEHGQTIVRVWGTPSEMGFAHGSLLRDAIIDVVDNYALQVVPPATLGATGTVLAKVGDISPALREEAAGIIDGMKSAGGAHISGLDRELTADDLLALNAMTDLVAIGCSSLSTWGDGVATDLDGAPMVVRNLDWSIDADLLEHQIVLVTMPSDPARQPMVSIGFAGYIACLSCINEAGVTTLFNMGYGDGAGSLATAASGFAPANLMLRDALEQRETDRADDVVSAVKAAKHVGSWILHVVEPAHEGSIPARVLEIEADGVAVRGPASDLGELRLAATNHLREKTAPQACSRYRRIEQTSRRTERFDRDTLWALGRSVRLPEVVHTVLVEPSSRALSIWLRRPGDAADSAVAPVRWAWSDLASARE
jgi:hypothetical protein